MSDLIKIKEYLLDNRRIAPSPDGRFQDCWHWTKQINDSGYGICCIPNQFRVHRVSALIYNVNIDIDYNIIPNFKFELDSTLRVLHRCDNPPCYNSEHLFIGTQADNIHDMCNKGRQIKSKIPLEIIDKITNIWINGTNKSQLDIANEFNLSKKQVYSILKNKINPKRNVLSGKDYSFIVDLYNGSVISNIEIAEMFNIHPNTVSKIIRKFNK